MSGSLDDWGNLHGILRELYDRMLYLCDDLTGVVTGIAGLGALLYVSYRVWQALARAEPVDLFPLLRPFCIGLAILLFQPVVLNTLNGVLSPLVVGVHQMLEKEMLNMQDYQEKKDRLEWEEQIHNSAYGVLLPDEQYDGQLQQMQLPDGDQQVLDSMYEVSNMFSLKHWLLCFVRWLLELLFDAASLVIDVLRTFHLIVLSVVGPLSFAFSVYDGFQGTLVQWFARYITVYLWLPVADLFSCMIAKLQTLSLEREIEMIGSGNWIPDASNTTYILFMIVALFGYFCVPSIASWIVQASGLGAYNRKLSGAASQVGNVAGALVGASVGNATGRLLKK